MCGQKAPVLEASAEEDEDLEDDAQARKKKVRPASALFFISFIASGQFFVFFSRFETVFCFFLLGRV